MRDLWFMGNHAEHKSTPHAFINSPTESNENCNLNKKVNGSVDVIQDNYCMMCTFIV